MAERLQKVLASAGVASRRQAEEWIRSGRVTVNGHPAALGQRVDEDDRIAVDGRRLRLERAAPAQLVLMYHRQPGERLRPGTDAADGEPAPAVYDRLPTPRGRRWLPLSPLAPNDGGLELFTTDGGLRAAASRLAHELGTAWSVRVRGEPDAALLESLPAAAAAAATPFSIDGVQLAGGEGRNHWLELATRGARGRDLRALLTARGLEVGRVMRTRYGPVALDPALARARHRELAPRERDQLYEALQLPRPGGAKRPPASGARTAAGRTRAAGRAHGPRRAGGGGRTRR